MGRSRSSASLFGMRDTRTPAFLLGLSVALMLAAGPAQAEKVGVAAAVNPDAFSSLSGTPNKQLNIGKSIFYNERINTTNSGLVQVLLVDGSTFTVGPNSNLVIDRFVYDPRKKTGELVATFSKGTMRFIGGKLSKNEGGVTVNTPSGALAIRGGMFQGSTSRGVYSFLFGDSLTFRGRNGQTQTVYQTGYSLDLSGGNANVRPTTPEDTNAFMAALSSTGTNFGSGAGGTNNPANPTGQQLTNIENGADQEIGDANFVMVQTAIQEQLTRLAKLQDTQNNPPQNNPTNPTDPVDPVDPPIKNGGKFNGYASGFLQTGTDGKGEPRFLVDGASYVKLDPDANSVTADIKVTPLGSTTTFNLGFGGSPENSTYTDDNIFLALANDGTSSVVRSESITRWVQTGRFFWQGKFVTEQVTTPYNLVSHTSPPDGGFASIPNAPLCKDCDFLKYGFWVSDVQYGNHNLNDKTAKMGGWWVGTNSNHPVVSPNDMPLDGTARYEGLAVGTLAERNGSLWTQTAGATGKMGMNWNFGHRAGWLQIDDFGGIGTPKKSFGGPMIAPGRVDFAGPIAGSGGIGAARGSFVGSTGPQTIPKGVMGDFGITGSNWKANGIFGGSPVPR